MLCLMLLYILSPLKKMLQHDGHAQFSIFKATVKCQIASTILFTKQTINNVDVKKPRSFKKNSCCELLLEA